MPVILNSWMLPAVLHSVIGTIYCTSEINSIILTALENKHPLHRFNFLGFWGVELVQSLFDILLMVVVCMAI